MFNSKDALLDIKTDDGCIHMSWKNNDKIIVFEEIAENSPTGGIFEFPNIKEYIRAINGTYWINCEDHVRRISTELKELGYPFFEQV